MSTTETCDICIARDREALIRPATERRLTQFVQEAIIEIRKLEQRDDDSEGTEQ
jgi:hypothetical protein